MGIRLVSALLIVAPLCSSTPNLPVFFQALPSQKYGDGPLPPQKYRDSPRPVPFQGPALSLRASEERLIKRVEPEYPHEAQAKGVKGDVIFDIIIGTDGRVKQIHLRRGKPLLVEAAARALSEWKYEPFVLDGKAVEVSTIARVRFRLPPRHAFQIGAVVRRHV